MSLCKNTIRPSDVSITPVKVKYQSTFITDYVINFENDSITANLAVNANPFSGDMTGSMSIIYRLIKQLYYQNYFTSSLNSTSSYWNWNQQSTTYSSSYEWENRYLPTGSFDKVAVICVPSSLFGENISRSTLNLKPLLTTTYNVIDDGNGNLIDTENNNKHIGNVIYSNGIIIITDSDYAPAFVSPASPPEPYYYPVGPGTSPSNGYVATNVGDIYVEFTA